MVGPNMYFFIYYYPYRFVCFLAITIQLNMTIFQKDPFESISIVLSLVFSNYLLF